MTSHLTSILVSAADAAMIGKVGGNMTRLKEIDEWIAEKTQEYDVATIPTHRAVCCWDRENANASFRFLDFDKALDRETQESRIWDKAESTLGACVADWKEGRNPRHTPLGRFAEMGFDGHLGSGDKFVRVLEEFAKVEGCNWAVHMLAALHMGTFLVNNEEQSL